MLYVFRNLSLMEFQVRYLPLFLLFSVISSFGWFWMGNLHKNIQLMLEFLKSLFLVPHFSCYTLMTFLMMLSVILLSMLMILLSTLNVIRHLQWRIQRLIWAHCERGKISWGSASPPEGTGQSPVGGWGAKPPENFDDLLVKITFVKLNMPFYET